VSVSLDRLGDIVSRRGGPGDADLALGYFKRSLKVRERLLKQNPDSAQAARDVSLNLDNLGDLLAKRGQPGDADLALGYYTRSLKEAIRLLEQNPDSAQTAKDVMVSHKKLAELHMLLGNFEAAFESFQNGINVLDTMIAKKLNVEESTRIKAVFEQKMNFCWFAALATGDWDALLKADANYVPVLLKIRATELAKRGKLADVAQAGAKLRELEPRTNGNLFDAACAYGLCATLVAKGKQDVTEAEQAERKSYVEFALTCMKEAIAAGFNNFDKMRRDTDLTPLRGLPEFEALFPKPDDQK
jgi:tetratricopeptide (TPR) repeat protein